MPMRTVRFEDVVGIATKTLIDPAVPKNRKPKFEVLLRIIDLSNVPLVSGSAFVKWHLPNSATAEHRGRTDKTAIRDHKVTWDHENTFGVRLVIDKTGMLQDSNVEFEVVQEYGSGARADRITLGTLKLNLAEYIEDMDEYDDSVVGITRRYLMQESKINSTLRIGVAMKQLDGDRNFICPPLKTAAVFGGIAGIMTNSESVDPNGSEEGLPSAMSSQKAKDFSEMQDMYRKSLAASWSCAMPELPADQCIEDIFSGGDGWGKYSHGRLPGSVPSAASNKMLSSSHGRLAPSRLHHGFAKRSHKRGSSKDLQQGFRSESASTRSSGNPEANSQSSGSDESREPNVSRLREVSEFELIDNMSSWRVRDSSVAAGRVS